MDFDFGSSEGVGGSAMVGARADGVMGATRGARAKSEVDFRQDGLRRTQGVEKGDTSRLTRNFSRRSMHAS